jgi:hypothetical protein
MQRTRSLVAGVVGVGMITTGAMAQSGCPATWTDSGRSVALPQLLVWYGPGAQFLDANGDGLQTKRICSPSNAGHSISGSEALLA